MKYIVQVNLVVESDSEQDAYYTCQYAVENMVAGDILESSIDLIKEVDYA